MSTTSRSSLHSRTLVSRPVASTTHTRDTAANRSSRSDMTRERMTSASFTAGGRRLPGGRGLVAFVLCVGAFSLVLAVTRTDIFDVPAALERLPDQRTAGEKAIPLAQANPAHAPRSPRLHARLARPSRP